MPQRCGATLGEFKVTGSNAQTQSFESLSAKALSAVYQAQTELIAAINKGDLDAQKKVVDWYCSALEPKLVAAVRLNARHKFKANLTDAGLCTIANTLDMKSECSEKVTLHARDKGNGKVRKILDFGNRHRTAQYIIRKFLSPHFMPKLFQAAGRDKIKSHKHKGVPGSLVAVKSRVEAGHVYFCHIDIIEFFQSFRIEELRKEGALGKRIPGKTLQAFAMGQGLHVGGHHSIPSNVRKEARRGIPTGSSLSPLIADMMVSRMPLPKALHSCVINYADNFMLLAASQQELEAIKTDFLTAVKDMPGGRFKVRIEDEGCFTDQVLTEFLGHSLRLQDGKLRFAVTPRNKDALLGRLDAILMQHKPEGMTPVEHWIESASEAYRFLQSWKRAFILCCGDDFDGLIDLALYGIEQQLKDTGCSLADLSACGKNEFTEEQFLLYCQKTRFSIY